MKTLDRIHPTDPLDPIRTMYPISDADPVPKADPPRASLNDVGRSLLDDAEVRAILETVARDFPHVVNRISAVWSEPSRCVKLLDELLLNDRPERKGFPLVAVLELSNLRIHYVERIAPRIKAERGSLSPSSLGGSKAKSDGFLARVEAFFRF